MAKLFGRKPIFCALLLASLGLAGCAAKEPPFVDPRGACPVPPEFEPKEKTEAFNPEENPHVATPRWARDKDGNFIRDDKGRPLIEGVNLPPVTDSKGKKVAYCTVFAEPLPAEDLDKATQKYVVTSLSKAQELAQKVREEKKKAEEEAKKKAEEKKKAKEEKKDEPPQTAAQEAPEPAKVDWKTLKEKLRKISGFSFGS